MTFFLSQLFNFFLYPVHYIFFFVGVMALFLWKRKNLKIPFLLFVAYLFLVSSPLGVWLGEFLEKDYPPVTQLQKKDAAVIMGGGMMTYFPEWKQHYYALPVGRTLEALKLYRQGWVKKIVVSGGDPQGIAEGSQGETPSIVQFLRDMNVPAEDILVEKESLNTYQEAVILKKLFAEWKIESFYLVTNATHMKRSMLCFLRQNLRPTPYPVNFIRFLPPMNPFFPFRLIHLVLLQSVLHEGFGMIFYKVMGYI